MRMTILLAVTLLAGCATSYEHRGFRTGFSETQLSENVFRVYFRGNGHTSEERAEDFTLLRSAELAEQHGYAFFIVVDENSSTDSAVFTTPTQTNTTATVTTVGHTAYGSAHSTNFGGTSFLIKRPSKRNTIVCFKDHPDVQGLVYEPKFVEQSIRAKYGMSP